MPRRHSWTDHLTVILAALVLAGPASAESEHSYFGFKLGGTTYDSAQKQLRQANAAFNPDLAYKGYGDLPIIKVTRHERFGKYGNLNAALLRFTPDDKLYKMSIEWGDSGETYQTLKDALDRKYGGGDSRGRGFSSAHTYRDGPVKVALKRNSFGFGNDQETTLVYYFTPAKEAVADMKQRIEEAIERKNAEKAAGDL